MRAMIWGRTVGGRLARVEAAMLIVATGLIATSPATSHELSWEVLAASVILAIAFFAVEAMPLHLEWSGQAYSLTLSEFPLVIGLLCWPTLLLIPARVVGGAAALTLHRKQPTQKLIFNVAMQYLEAAVAVRVFYAMPAHGQRPVMYAAPAVIAAAACSTAIAMAATCAAIRIAVGSLNRETLRSCAWACVASILVSPAIALVVVSAWQDSHETVLPAMVVVLTVGAVYRAYASLRQRHSSLETLYAFTRSIGRNGTTEDQIRDVLSKTRDLLRSESAGILLDIEDGKPTIRRLDSEGRMHVEQFQYAQADWPFARAMSSNTAAVLPRSTRSLADRSFLEHRDMRDAILAPLQLDGENRGVLFVHDRRSDVATYTDDDGKLFETVATHVANVLDNSRLVDQLRHESCHDALTGLKNRAYFRAHLAAAATRQARFTLLLADLDRFKEINDTLGHHYGDLLIREVSARITAAAPPHSVIARLGGDEFALLVPAESIHEARAIAEAVRAAIAVPSVVDGVAIDVDASIGVVLASAHGTDETVLLKRADMAMYAAKSAGTGVEVYDPARDEYSPRRLALASELRVAIERNQLVLEYQPQVTMDGQLVGVEALVRWLHPQYGRVLPGEFVHLAEHSGAIVPMTNWVLTTALNQLAMWHRGGLPISMSVNVSMRNLLDANIVDVVGTELRRRGIAPHFLTLEITESHIMSDVARTLPILHKLAKLGVRLSIDDFGTGYSSLAYLQQFPVHEIKIDKSFVMALESAGSESIAQAILSIAASLGVDAVAEGVETPTIAAKLRAMGCTRLQGYYVAPPIQPGHLGTVIEDSAIIRLPEQRVEEPAPAGA